MSCLSPYSAAYYQGSFLSCPEQLEALEMCHDMENLRLTAVGQAGGTVLALLHSKVVEHQEAQPGPAMLRGLARASACYMHVVLLVSSASG